MALPYEISDTKYLRSECVWKLLCYKVMNIYVFERYTLAQNKNY